MLGKVLVGVSGGVDSSVAVELLKEQGYYVEGITMEHVDISEDEKQEIKKVCDALDIKHHFIDLKEDFEKCVVEYFVDSYNNGETPSPCIICDENIKFSKLIEFALENGFDYFATGHYAKKGKIEEFGVTALIKGIDSHKDQSYMLYRLTPEQLDRTLFPLGDITKKEVRELASKYKLPTKEKKDSQGICFAKEGYIDFLKKRLGDKVQAGDFVDLKGNYIGKHEGYQLYTIGQRRGLGLNVGRPYFVIDINPAKNQVIIDEYEYLFKDKVELIDTKFITEDLSRYNGMDVIVKPRFSSNGLAGTVEIVEDKVNIHYKDSNTQNSRGQHIVLYYKGFVIGGGKIL